MDQGSLPLSRTILVNPSSSSSVPIMKAYSTYATGAAKAIRDSLSSKATDKQIDQDVSDMVEFESELAKVKKDILPTFDTSHLRTAIFSICLSVSSHERSPLLKRIAATILECTIPCC